MGIATKLNYTPEDLLAMPDNGRYELVDGQLLEQNVGKRSSRISTRLLVFLGQFVSLNNLGVVFQSDLGLQIFPDAGRVRFADGSFYADGHDESPDGPGYLHTPPDLVFEVVSEHDGAVDLDLKVTEYLQAGVRLVWVVYPESNKVNVFRPGRLASRLSVGDMLDGEDVVPGFTLPVSDLFG
ncbi:MAG: Uma2 family endonuclease [bacterium]